MENEEKQGVPEEPWAGVSWLWFLGGCALSVTTLCSVVLLLLLLISTSVNAYLAWTMSGYEISVSRPSPVSAGTAAIVPTPTSALAMVSTPTATVEPTSTPTPAPAKSTLEIELATLAAIATSAAESQPTNTPTCTPTLSESGAPPAGSEPASEMTVTPTAAASGSKATAETEASVKPLAASTNSYTLIPIEGRRETRPPEEHGDLNLKLREPQPAEFEASLVDIPGSGIDPEAPNLGAIFEPDFVATYAVHDWDWNCNCKGELIEDGMAVLVSIRTTPGEPIFIPQTTRDIYEGKYYAVVLYASEDSLTFVYARAGNVVNGFTVHYLGLQTDPNLIALFQESKGSQLPGLTLDTPVGVATDELLVAMRDNGKFLDARSKRDWWD